MMTDNRIHEPTLIIPTLLLLRDNGPLSTTLLIKTLRVWLKPKGLDAELLTHRNDDKFSQIVRNLQSHKTLVKQNLATFVGGRRKGKYKITNKGLKYISENKHILDFILNSNYKPSSKINSLNKWSKSIIPNTKSIEFDENMIISEGALKTGQKRIYKRSLKLRNFAIKKFTKNGHIMCTVCEFDFFKKYGLLGQGYIEIHHTESIVSFKGNEKIQFLRDAVKLVKPVCSNCHRMLHRKKIVISTNELKKHIQQKKSKLRKQ
jgi:predicted HNH restriction endonuclease